VRALRRFVSLTSTTQQGVRDNYGYARKLPANVSGCIRTVKRILRLSRLDTRSGV
jgi:hypothetical protein